MTTEDGKTRKPLREGQAARDQNQITEARYEAILDHAPVLVDSFGADGRCLIWNKECERTFGWTIEEINSHENPLSLFYPDPTVQHMGVTATPTTSSPTRWGRGGMP